MFIFLSKPRQTFVTQAVRSPHDKAVRRGDALERTAVTSSVAPAAK